MARCSCSTRALELFICDFAGVGLRPLPMHRSPGRFRSSRIAFSNRSFGTRFSPARQMAGAGAEGSRVGRGLDDGFVSFDSEGLLGKRKEDVEGQRAVRGEEEWHAEIEVGNLEEMEALEGAGRLEGPVPQEKENGGQRTALAEGTIDSVRLQGREMSAMRSRPNVPTLQMPPQIPAVVSEKKDMTKDAKDHEAVESQSTRSVSRMKRKLRRLQAGTWRPSAADLPEAQAEETVEQLSTPVEKLQTVLDKIEALDGPSLPTRKPKTKKIDDKPPMDSADLAKIRNERRLAKKAAKIAAAPPSPKKQREDWQIQKSALSIKFGEDGWQPRKRLSPDTLEGIRALHASDSAVFTTDKLADHFKISPEAIRRVLRSKWKPSDRELDDRRARWERRGVKKWQDMADKGMRPPARWRAMGIGGEDGLRDESVPKRKKKEDGLTWDEVVGGLDGLGERIL